MVTEASDAPGVRPRPRLSQILYSGLGGHGSVAFSLLRGDVHKVMGHSLLFVGVEPVRNEYLTQCSELGVSHDAVRKQVGFDKSSWHRVWQALRRQRPDVLLVHSMTLVPVALAYSKVSSCKLICVDHQPNAVKRKVEWLATSMSLLLSDQTVVLTDTFRDELRAALGPVCRLSRVTTINNGIDVDRFSPVEMHEERDPVTISMQSRFSATKDQATLVKAFARLRDRMPGRDLQLVLAGDGTTWGEVQRLVTELGLSDSVTMPGMLDEEALIECLHATDIYVHSSRGEVMSTAVMQAMACGLPVIGTDISGINNMVEPGRTGALFPVGDVDGLAALLAEWIEGPEHRRAMSMAARQVAEERFSNTRMFRRYAKLFGVATPAC